MMNDDSQKKLFDYVFSKMTLKEYLHFLDLFADYVFFYFLKNKEENENKDKVPTVQH